MEGIAGLSLLDCFDEEREVDMERFSHFQRIQMEEFDDIDELVSDLEEEDEEEGDDKRKRDAKTVASNRESVDRLDWPYLGILFGCRVKGTRDTERRKEQELKWIANEKSIQNLYICLATLF